MTHQPNNLEDNTMSDELKKEVIDAINVIDISSEYCGIEWDDNGCDCYADHFTEAYAGMYGIINSLLDTLKSEMEEKSKVIRLDDMVTEVVLKGEVKQIIERHRING